MNGRVTNWTMAVGVVIAVCTLTLATWRWTDRRSDNIAWAQLIARQPSNPPIFERSMLAGLPSPAQRYFEFTIRPGTLLHTVAEISMAGDFSLGDKEKHRSLPLQAEQVLASPYGFVWQLQTSNLVSVSGSDGALDDRSWSRFWLLGLLPVARAGDNGDHFRASFGRHVAESVFWTPAALLPSEHVQWAPIDKTSSLVTVTFGSLEQSVEVSVDEYGKPTKVLFERWSNANPSKTFQLQPFGGYLSDFRAVGGFQLPMSVEAGNFFGTDDYFPFFKVTVHSIRFPEANNRKEAEQD